MSATNPVASPFTDPTDRVTEFQALQFLLNQRLRKVNTAMLVQVQAVNGGGLGPVGTVDVIPLVDQVDGAGNAVPHVTIYSRPYVRWQGGTNAIILDPKVGDKGLMVFGARDLSAVVATGRHGPPPSARTFSFADGLYVGTMLGAMPTSYTQWLDDGTIKIVSPTAVDVTAPAVNVTTTGNVDINGVKIDAGGNLDANSLADETAATGTFTSADGHTVTVVKGIVRIIA